MKTVIHAGSQPQGHIGPILDGLNQFACSGREPHETGQTVREALGLKYLRMVDAATFAHDGIARACQDVFALVYGSSARFKFACKAVVHAVEFGFCSLAQIKV